MRRSWIQHLILGLALASFSPRAVRRAAAGDPRRLFGLGVLPVALGAGLAVRRRVGRPAPDIRFVPDPWSDTLEPVSAALELTAMLARLHERDATLELGARFDGHGRLAPYAVTCRHPEPPPPPRETADGRSTTTVCARLPTRTRAGSTAQFRVASENGVRLTLRPEAGGGFELRHDAPDPDPRWTRLQRWLDPGALAAALLAWNLCRHGALAGQIPPPGLFLLAALAVRVNVRPAASTPQGQSV